MAVACPPKSPAFDEAIQRGYMARTGWCNSGYRPVMKRIVAVAGDMVAFDGPGGTMQVNGDLIPNSAHQVVDAAGRPMIAWRGGIIPARQVLLVSDYDPHSYDGRYYGPIPEASVYAYTKPVLTIP